MANRSAIVAVFLYLLLGMFSPFIVSAEESGTVQLKVKAVSPTQAGIGERIRVQVDKLVEAIQQDKQFNPRDLALYLDGRVLKGVRAEPVGEPSDNWLEFTLRRTDESKQAWLALIHGGTGTVRSVPVSVGFEEKQQVPVLDKPVILDLRIYDHRWLVFSLLGILGLVGVFWSLAVSTDIIRDRIAGCEIPQRRPYSLAWFQMAFWFFIVLSCLIYIRLLTGDSNVITDQALMLMGIGTGTALGAAAIQTTKDASANRQVASLRPEEARLTTEVADLQNAIQPVQTRITAAPPGTPQDVAELARLRPQLADRQARLAEIQRQVTEASSGRIQTCSQGFLLDLLTDANGVSLHRFQLIIWTFVFGVLFVLDVYRNLAMPEFSGTQLALIGIGSGTYLGFKIPERQG